MKEKHVGLCSNEVTRSDPQVNGDGNVNPILHTNILKAGLWEKAPGQIGKKSVNKMLKLGKKYLQNISN